MRLFALLSALLLLPGSIVHAEDNIGGHVTRVGSPADFDVDGVRILLTPATILQSRSGETYTELHQVAPVLGQFANVSGRIDRKALTIASTRIVFFTPQPAVVSGSAIIDRDPVPVSSRQFLVRADGRNLQISADILDHPVKLSPAAAPAATLADLHTNVWIDYKGQRRADGIVVVDQASFVPNSVLNSEGKLLRKSDYDPGAVPDDSHQSGASKFFTGTRLKLIPPFHDAALQARVDRIAETLIPAFQKALPGNDPTRIHYRFQLVDEPKWHDAITLPSGVILVPRQIAERLTNDSQLAAVLADNIATALEKQTWRQQPAARSLVAGDVAGQVAGFFIPGVGLATSLAAYKTAKVMMSHAEQQSGRVALALMHDAGYDLAQAPEAWWILASKAGTDPHLKPPPARAVNLYQELGTTWQPQAAPLP